MPEDEELHRSTSMKIYSEWCAKKLWIHLIVVYHKITGSSRERCNFGSI